MCIYLYILTLTNHLKSMMDNSVNVHMRNKSVNLIFTYVLLKTRDICFHDRVQATNAF